MLQSLHLQLYSQMWLIEIQPQLRLRYRWRDFQNLYIAATIVIDFYVKQ